MTDCVLIHGAYQQGWVWQDLAASLDHRGHRVQAVDLPSARADHVVHLPGAHMVQLSRPDELAEVLDRIGAQP